MYVNGLHGSRWVFFTRYVSFDKHISVKFLQCLSLKSGEIDVREEIPSIRHDLVIIYCKSKQMQKQSKLGSRICEHDTFQG